MVARGQQPVHPLDGGQLRIGADLHHLVIIDKLGHLSPYCKKAGPGGPARTRGSAPQHPLGYIGCGAAAGAGWQAKSQVWTFRSPAVYSMTAYSPGSSGCCGQIWYSPSSTCLRKTAMSSSFSITSFVTGCTSHSCTTRTPFLGIIFTMPKFSSRSRRM